MNSSDIDPQAKEFDDKIFNLNSENDLKIMLEKMMKFDEGPTIKANSIKKGPGRPSRLTSKVSKATTAQTPKTSNEDPTTHLSGINYLVKIVQVLFNKFEAIESKIDKVNDNLEKYEGKFKEQNEKIITLTSCLASKDIEIQDLHDNLDSVEQEVRSKDVILSGPIISQFNASVDHPTPNQCAEMLEQTIRIPSSSVFHIDKVMPIGLKKKSLLIKFNSSRLKRDIFDNIKLAKPNSIYATDSLTKKRSKLYFDLRQLKKEHGNLLSIRIRHGTPYAKTHNDEWTSICNNTALNNLNQQLQDLN